MTKEVYQSLLGLHEIEFKKHQFKDQKGRRLAIDTMIDSNGMLIDLKFIVYEGDNIRPIYIHYQNVDVER